MDSGRQNQGKKASNFYLICEWLVDVVAYLVVLAYKLITNVFVLHEIITGKLLPLARDTGILAERPQNHMRNTHQYLHTNTYGCVCAYTETKKV